MKKAIIVHGWDGSPEEPMHRWLKKELEKRGYDVIVPKMPNPGEPEIGAWVSYLNKIIGKLDEKTLLIGHSIGCQTIMRYLAKENFNGKINIIFIAGWFKLDNLESKEIEAIAKPWLTIPINFNKVKQKINSLVVFLSNNEPYNFVDYNAKMFKEKLGAKTVILKNMGHFSEDTGVKQLPEILQFIT